MYTHLVLLFISYPKLMLDLHSNAEPLMLGGLRRAVIKPQDPSIERELFLSLSDLFHGGTKKIRISRRVRLHVSLPF